MLALYPRRCFFHVKLCVYMIFELFIGSKCINMKTIAQVRDFHCTHVQQNCCGGKLIMQLDTSTHSTMHWAQTCCCWWGSLGGSRTRGSLLGCCFCLRLKLTSKPFQCCLSNALSAVKMAAKNFSPENHRKRLCLKKQQYNDSRWCDY